MILYYSRCFNIFLLLLNKENAVLRKFYFRFARLSLGAKRLLDINPASEAGEDLLLCFWEGVVEVYGMTPE